MKQNAGYPNWAEAQTFHTHFTNTWHQTHCGRTQMSKVHVMRLLNARNCTRRWCHTLLRNGAYLTCTH